MSSSNSKPSKSKGKGKKARQTHPAANISGPVGGPVMVPPVYRDERGMPITHKTYDLDKAIIVQALESMAAYLIEKNELVNPVTVGGAVNTIYLRSRNSTHDVDFFLPSPESKQNAALHEAARHANRLTHGALGGEWFNNSTQVMMGRSIQQNLADVAFKQHEIVFERIDSKKNAGLRLFAAPWSYAFWGKLNRLCESNPRPYDINDAVIYLHEYLRHARQSQVSVRAILQWCADFRKNVNNRVLEDVNAAYRKEYGKSAINMAG